MTEMFADIVKDASHIVDILSAAFHAVVSSDRVVYRDEYDSSVIVISKA